MREISGGFKILGQREVHALNVNTKNTYPKQLAIITNDHFATIVWLVIFSNNTFALWKARISKKKNVRTPF